MILNAPYFLLGLLAVAIPVIIHLVQLRRPKRILFTNVAFIRNIENITSSQRKIKEWLVLLCRILFITFLVLVFAQPFIPAANSGLNQADTVKIFLDNSFSMQNEADRGGISLLDEAEDEAVRMVKNFPASTRFQVLDNSFRATAGRTISRDNVTQVIPQIGFSPLSRATDVVVSRLAPTNTTENTATFWFSDFQKTSFDPGFVARLDTVSPLNLVLLKPLGVSNIFIDSVALEDELVRPEESNRLRVRLFNAGPENKNAITLKLIIGQRLASTVSVDLKAKSAGLATLDFRLTESGPQLARLEIEDQPVTFDNVYNLVLQPASPIHILDVNRQAVNNLSRLYVNEPLFIYKSIEPERINNQIIEQADLILLNEIGTISPALTDNLKKFVASGGNLVIIPSEEGNQGSYSRLFQSLGMPVSEFSKGEGTSGQLSLPDLKDPFYRNIFASLDKRIQMPASPRLLNWNRADADILTFRNGGRFLSRFRYGQGRVYLFAAPLTLEANEFSRNALFVPVMYKLALSSHQADQQLAYNFNQRTFSLPVPKTDIRKNVFSLENDSVRYIPEQQLRGGRMYFTIPPEMAEAGFYRLKHSDSTLATLAFNYPKAESLMDFYTAQELRDLISNRNVTVFESGANASFSSILAQETQGTPLWPYCLVLCLIFLLAEILIIRFV